MKICTYCDTKYSINGLECPSCGASDFKMECNFCNTIHSEDVCPNCGKSSFIKQKACVKCGYHSSERMCPNCGHDSMSTHSVKDSVASIVAISACKLTGHKWVGCKCTRCGKTRDTDHDFKPVANKCEQKCSICGKSKEIPHDWRNGTCQRCGVKKGFIEKSWDKIGQKVPYLHLEKESNRSLILLLFISLSLFFMFGIMSLLDSTPNNDSEILLPNVLNSFEDVNYEDVVVELEESGFINIKTFPKGDLIIGWLNEEGEVASVLIDGNQDFDVNKRYANDVEIVIEYHSFPIEKNEENQEGKSNTYVYNGQIYEIVDSYTTGIELTQYWVYTAGFDYSSEDFKQVVKDIIIDIARVSNTTDIIVEVVTDKEIIYFESNNTINEYMDRYGSEYYEKTIIPKEKSNYIASYTGGFDSNTSLRSIADSAYEIIWFIASDDPEFEQWKPNITP